MTALVLVWHPTSWLAAENTYKPTVYTPHHERAAAMMGAVPEGARVSASGYLAVHLQPGRDVRMFPYELDRADHVLVDLQRPTWPRTYRQVQDELLRLPARGFTLVDSPPGTGLFRFVRQPPADPRAARAQLRAQLDHVVVEAELSEQTGFMGGAAADATASNGAYRRASPAAAKGPDFLQYGPYAALSPGRYRVTYRLRWRPSGPLTTPADRVVATLDATASHGRDVKAKQDLRPADLGAGGWQDRVLDIAVQQRDDDLELRVFYHGIGALDLDVIRVDPAGAP